MKLLKAHLELHLIVFIWGFTAILGKAISIEAIGIVWYRMLIAFLALTLWIVIRKKYEKLDGKFLLQLFGIGVVTALHWLTFFWSIKVANVSVALACLSTTTLFIAIIEPVVLKRPIRIYEVVIGIVIAIALFIIFQFEADFSFGIVLSLCSAFCAAIFSVYNAKFVAKTNASLISTIEMLAGFLFISAYLGISSFFIEYDWCSIFDLSERINYKLWLPSNDLILLLFLGIICTAFAFVESVRLMKILSPYTIAVVTNLEPVYGIILAWLLFQENEEMTSNFYLGASLIFVVILANTFLKAKYTKENELA